MIRTSRRLAFIALAMALLSGCAFGNKHRFDYQPTPGPNLGQGVVVTIFPGVDLRPDIVSGDEAPTWVGEQRGGYGNPFDVETESQRPFAAIVQETVLRDLQAVGFRPVALGQGAATDPATVAQAMQTSGATRALSVVIHKFNSNTYANIDVEWDFEASVFAPDGAVLAMNRVQGKETLEGSFWNPPAEAKEKVPPFFYARIHDLIVADPEMMAALTASPAPAPAP